MSEPAPEPPGSAPAAGGFMSRKFLGIPAIFWLLGAVLIAYLYFRNRSGGGTTGATSTAGSGQATTGDISIAPATTALNVKSQFGPNQNTVNPKVPPRHRTHNPQPKPPHRKPVKKHQRMHPVTHGGESENDSGSG